MSRANVVFACRHFGDDSTHTAANLILLSQGHFDLAQTNPEVPSAGFVRMSRAISKNAPSALMGGDSHEMTNRNETTNMSVFIYFNRNLHTLILVRKIHFMLPEVRMNAMKLEPHLSLMQGGNFPLYSLPSSIYEACADVQAATQAPAELIIAQCLGVAATVCQANFDVELPHGQRVPCSLNLITLGASGERKSTVNQLMTKPLFEFQRAVDAQAKEILRRYETEQETWQAQQRGLLKAFEKSTSKGCAE